MTIWGNLVKFYWVETWLGKYVDNRESVCNLPIKHDISKNAIHRMLFNSLGIMMMSNVGLVFHNFLHTAQLV